MPVYGDIQVFDWPISDGEMGLWLGRRRVVVGNCELGVLVDKTTLNRACPAMVGAR